MSCFQEDGKPSDEIQMVEYSDSGRYEFQCSAGHQSVTVLQQEKFEVLFQIGTNAILDGYYREAVSSFTASMERFFEFCIKLFSEAQDLDKDIYAKSWKHVSSQSERQLGAFVFLWSIVMGESPNLLPNSQVSFRNKVIHKGLIPSRDQAIKYGDIMLRLLAKKFKAIKDKFPEEYQKLVFENLTSSRKEGDTNVSTISISSILAQASALEGDDMFSLSKKLEEMKDSPFRGHA